MPFQKRRDFLKEIINSFVAEHRAAAAEGDKEEPEQPAEPEEDAAAQEVCPGDTVDSGTDVGSVIIPGSIAAPISSSA